MITLETLSPYESLGVVAAARGLQLHTTTVHRLARRLGFHFKTHTAEEQLRRQQLRKHLSVRVRVLARQRLSQREICERLGITRAVLRRIASEYGININNRQRY